MGPTRIGGGVNLEPGGFGSAYKPSEFVYMFCFICILQKFKKNLGSFLFKIGKKDYEEV